MINGPQYFDLQVNGYDGVDFNSDDASGRDYHRACTRLANDGVEGILATVITDDIDAMVSRLRRIVRARDEDEIVRKVIQGIHIEGPFINERTGYVGAHPANSVRPADTEVMLQLLEAAEGLTRIVTLAPERDGGLKVTQRLSQEGVIVSAGHCEAPLDVLRAAVDSGLSMFTHVGNGCPKEIDRHDNVIQRVLSFADHLWCCFIADGVHIPFYALGNYLQVAGVDRSIVVTDAISAAGLGPGQYTIGGQQVDVDEYGVTSIAGDKSHLAGSVATMTTSADNLRNHLHLDEDSICMLTSLNPQKALSLT
ncbi:N-acetylglucosamine-6-phosphate deacetylase [Adhaeretor mobilis]|uniref:N-acetylglucosamine-6-phosphate deacetylase n=1 Tax=Adhaeretor mobilis TaxID=1930276 RepID=A0A517MZS7_9BACT|nr:N-acetylglucosamine-6-phosphate deacetylase [Adhaeretor mobilis]QDS99064.1 N-acetylglucosamine-6-phosphate deacetylase [Adhaeretor mobilis]QDS99138.1 N-acetylglucosamine-6-phosphate deacetylase [Adhaeretor mobilis]QDT00386.1 N-acetylglucosamine-6-phosphate deacetylase [Adhaeretor mobilis]